MSSGPSDPPAFAPEILFARAGGDPAVVRDVLETFLAGAPEDLFNIETAARAGHERPLTDAAHHWMGGALEIGAEPLAAACRAFIAKHGPSDVPLETRLAALRAEYARVREAVVAYLAARS
jgi:hypothetical protein